MRLKITRMPIERTTQLREKQTGFLLPIDVIEPTQAIKADLIVSRIPGVGYMAAIEVIFGLKDTDRMFYKTGKYASELDAVQELISKADIIAKECGVLIEKLD